MDVADSSSDSESDDFSKSDDSDISYSDNDGEKYVTILCLLCVHFV